MAKQRPRFWLSAAAALVAGLLLRLWFLHHFPRIAGDSLVYGDIARNLLLHHTYGFTETGASAGSVQIRSTLIRLPGYPLFLAACFQLFGMQHYGAAMYVQIGADLLTCLLAAALAGRLLTCRAMLPVLWLAALCPFTANYCAAPLTEVLVLTTIALAFFGLAGWLEAGCRVDGWIILIAAALGSSILLRPEQGILAAAVVPAMLLGSLVRRPAEEGPGKTRLHLLLPALLTAAITLAPLVPWTARNWHTFHVFEPLAPRSATDPGELHVDGFNHWYRTWAIEFTSTEDVYWNYDGSTLQVTDLPARAFALGCQAPEGVAQQALPLYAATAALLDEYNQQTSATPAFDARFAALAAQRTRAAPLCTRVLMPLARLADMTLRPRTEMLPVPVAWWKPSTATRQRIFAAGYAALNLVYLVLAAFGLAKSLPAAAPATRLVLGAMAVSVLLRCALLLTLDNSEARYTLEFFPIVFVFAGGVLVRPKHAATWRSDRGPDSKLF